MKYDIEIIEDMCLSYGYTTHNSGYMLYVSKIRSEDEEMDKENWWKPEIHCKIINDDFNIDEYIIDRFAICFSGYGTLTFEEENKVIKNIRKAKELVDKLNDYISKCNNKSEELDEMVYYVIDRNSSFARVGSISKNQLTEEQINDIDELGVYFSTKELAEKAIELYYQWDEQ